MAHVKREPLVLLLPFDTTVLEIKQASNKTLVASVFTEALLGKLPIPQSMLHEELDEPFRFKQ